MGGHSQNDDKSRVQNGGFPTTRWTLLNTAKQSDDPIEADAANEALFEAYWPCLNRYVRAWGFSQHDAEDLTQGFLTKFIEKGSLSLADPEKGKLRTFLLSSLKNFVIHRIEELHTAKRGGGRTAHSISTAGEAEIENGLVGIPDADPPPDSAFDRSWAAAVMKRAMGALEADYTDRDRAQQFVELKAFLGWNEGDTPHAEIADRLGIKTSQVALQVFRMRQRLRTFVIREVRGTIGEHENVDDELRYLSSLFSGA